MTVSLEPSAVRTEKHIVFALRPLALTEEERYHVPQRLAHTSRFFLVPGTSVRRERPRAARACVLHVSSTCRSRPLSVLLISSNVAVGIAPVFLIGRYS